MRSNAAPSSLCGMSSAIASTAARSSASDVSGTGPVRAAGRGPAPSRPPRSSGSPGRSRPGTRSSLSITSSAALASSSICAICVTRSSRPAGSIWPSYVAQRRGSRSTRSRRSRDRSARHVRTCRTRSRAIGVPQRSSSVRRMRSADASGSFGRSAAVPSATFDMSTPAFAHTNPCCVSTMRWSGVSRTIRLASRFAIARASSRVSAGTMRPSAFETIFCAITTTSPRLDRRTRRAIERADVGARPRPRAGRRRR